MRGNLCCACIHAHIKHINFAHCYLFIFEFAGSVSFVETLREMSEDHQSWWNGNSFNGCEDTSMGAYVVDQPIDKQTSRHCSPMNHAASVSNNVSSGFVCLCFLCGSDQSQQN